jgi:hypothetical protein
MLCLDVCAFVGKTQKMQLPLFGPSFLEVDTWTIPSILHSARNTTPVLFLLSPGSDPTEGIQAFARKTRAHVSSFSYIPVVCLLSLGFQLLCVLAA